jgi:CRISPR-associated protein Csd1
MILQALAEQYERLLEDPDIDIAVPGYSRIGVIATLILDKEGHLIDVHSMMQQRGKKLIPTPMMVPEQAKRTSGVSANLLCDNSGYTLGCTRDKQGMVVITHDKFCAFQGANLALLEGLSGSRIEAFRAFLSTWDPAQADTNPILLRHADDLFENGQLAFRLDGDAKYVNEDDLIRQAWESQQTRSDAEWVSQCLVTGDILPIAKLHPSIKKVPGAQSSGASLVSFNNDAFISYGKEQSFNAPVSRKAVFAYGTALNHLLDTPENRIQIADTTLVFWADRKGAKREEEIFRWSFDPQEPISEDSGPENARQMDPHTVSQAKNVLSALRNGRKPGKTEFDPDVRCYLLGLAPNAARLSLRLWRVNSFGELLSNVSRHYTDLDIVGMERFSSLPSPYRLLKAVSVQEDPKNMSPLLGSQLANAILFGTPYPIPLLHAAIRQSRTGGAHGGVTTIRAAIVKAVLLRYFRSRNEKEKEDSITMGLNVENPNAGYQLGRMFALLEKAQRDALGSQINATIRDRYFGTASASPGSVFPLLMRLSRHHLNKADSGGFLEKEIQKVANRLMPPFPPHLSLEDQGQFILGYYHENQMLYTKRGNRDDVQPLDTDEGTDTGKEG